jgi:SAM-dependent methyltransferase
MTCPFCGSSRGEIHEAREMMFGLRTRFDYWQCSECESIHLANPPEDLGAYYPDNYYSFHSQAPHWTRLAFYRAHLAAPGLMSHVWPCRREMEAIIRLKPRRGTTILDVGCGAGYLVEVLRKLGFDATGIDAFLPEETPHVRRATLDQVPGKWDIIIFNYSMEHMPDHLGLLRSIADRLTPNGVCITHIPVVGWAWHNYGTDWVHLDPPRHLIVHSQKSIDLVARQSGLEICDIVHESSAFTIWGSELYKRDISLAQGGSDLFAKREMKEFSRTTEIHNRESQGDIVAFYLKRAASSEIQS